MNDLLGHLQGLRPLANLFLLCLSAWGFFYICRSYLVRFIRAITQDLSGVWGQVLFDPKLLSQLSWILPIGLLHIGTPMIEGLPEELSTVIQRVAMATLVVLALRSATIFLGKCNEVYSTLQVSRNRPIKGIIQVILIILHILGAILVISSLMDRSPLVFLSGLGAMTAILLLVFRDTILSLVAGVQLTTNDLVRVGDWIEMPQFNADGDVVDIALHAVRVQNWDKTFTVIPTHKFLEHSFKNWRGMQETGGRRIKRSINIDVSTIRFLTDEEIEKFSNFAMLKDYIKQKKAELAEYNKNFAHDPKLKVNGRRLTNIGTFRAYLANYLKNHPGIHKNMLTMVRQLQPGAEGLPLEIYAFTNDVRWVYYEPIQADIFDHVFSIIPEFGLGVYQRPSGQDLSKGFRTQAFGDPAEALALNLEKTTN